MVLPSEKDEDSEFIVTSIDYHNLEETVIKLDLLGHTTGGILKKLREITGVNFKDIDLSDPMIINTINDCRTIGLDPHHYPYKAGSFGLPELGTDLLISMIEKIKPKNITDIVRINGVSHGTETYTGNAEKLLDSGKTIDEVITTRDEMFNQMKRYGMDPIIAFGAIDKIRKGKSPSQEQLDEMKKYLPDWYYNSALKISYLFPLA